jgi:hypothetical protein
MGAIATATAAFDGALPDGHVPMGDVIQSWQDVIEALRETKIGLASILDLCEAPRFSEGVYWLNVPSTFHESQVRKGQNLRILTEQVQKLTNISVTIKTRVMAGGDGMMAGGESGAGGPAADASDYAEPARTGPRIKSRPRAEAGPDVGETSKPRAADIAAVIEKDPVVRALVENLGGKVVGIRRKKSGPGSRDRGLRR